MIINAKPKTNNYCCCLFVCSMNTVRTCRLTSIIRIVNRSRKRKWMLYRTHTLKTFRTVCFQRTKIEEKKKKIHHIF